MEPAHDRPDGRPDGRVGEPPLLQVARVQLLVRHASTSTLDAVHLGAPVSELKGCIAAKMGVRAGAQVLTFEGKPLRDEFAVGSYGVRAGSTVHLAYRGRGGGCSHSKGGPAGSAEWLPSGSGRPPASQTRAGLSRLHDCQLSHPLQTLLVAGFRRI